MNWFKYIIDSVKKLSTQDAKDCLEQVVMITGKSKPEILWDMALCAFRHQAGYRDYTIFGMYDMTEEQRKNILTRGKNQQYIAALNSPADRHYFENKTEFLEFFSDEIGRDYLDLTKATFDDFEAFFQKHPQMFAKPEEGLGGKGVEKVDPQEEGSAVALYNRLKTSGQTLIEEVLEQHVALDALYPDAVNTVRMVTMTGQNGAPHLLYAAIRLGRSGSTIDNFHSGGLVCPIDMKKGHLIGPAADLQGEAYESHPDSGIRFDGYFLPYWKEVLTLTAKATQKIPGIRFVGWDLAITATGPVLVAATPTPGHDIYQLVAQNPEKKGMLPIFDAAVPYEWVKKGNKD